MMGWIALLMSCEPASPSASDAVTTVVTYATSDTARPSAAPTTTSDEPPIDDDPCPADPWPLSDLDVHVEVEVRESYGFDNGVRTDPRVTFAFVPRTLRYDVGVSHVFDPYTGGEDCERWRVERFAEVTFAGDVADFGPITWQVADDRLTVERSFGYFHGYQEARWLPTEDAPSFDSDSVEPLYGRRVGLEWAGGEDASAGRLDAPLVLPEPIGLREPFYSTTTTELVIRWDHVVPGTQLRLFADWTDDDGSEVFLDCRIDDDGEWRLPPSIASTLPDAFVLFDVERANRCPQRSTPWGLLRTAAVVRVPLSVHLVPK